MPNTDDYVQVEADAMLDAPLEVTAFYNAKDTITLSIAQVHGPDGWPVLRFTGPEVAVGWLTEALGLATWPVDEYLPDAGLHLVD